MLLVAGFHFWSVQSRQQTDTPILLTDVLCFYFNMKKCNNKLNKRTHTELLNTIFSEDRPQSEWVQTEQQSDDYIQCSDTGN